MDTSKVLTPNQLRYRLAIATAQLRTLEAAYRDSGDSNQANIIVGVISDIYEARKFFAHSDEMASEENELTPLRADN